jgi:hypothetical protein
MTAVTDWDRIGQDLWPPHRRLLVRRALKAEDGRKVRLSDGEAETLARQETEREVATRLRFYELVDGSQSRPTPKPRPHYVDLDV